MQTSLQTLTTGRCTASYFLLVPVSYLLPENQSLTVNFLQTL
jgi:hypothetical protein